MYELSTFWEVVIIVGCVGFLLLMAWSESECKAHNRSMLELHRRPRLTPNKPRRRGKTRTFRSRR